MHVDATIQVYTMQNTEPRALSMGNKCSTYSAAFVSLAWWVLISSLKLSNSDQALQWDTSIGTWCPQISIVILKCIFFSRKASIIHTSCCLGLRILMLPSLFLSAAHREHTHKHRHRHRHTHTHRHTHSHRHRHTDTDTDTDTHTDTQTHTHIYTYTQTHRHTHSHTQTHTHTHRHTHTHSHTHTLTHTHTHTHTHTLIMLFKYSSC